jgi:hypothetical protein
MASPVRITLLAVPRSFPVPPPQPQLPRPAPAGAEARPHRSDEAVTLSGYAHAEKNWGGAFPSAYLWAQGVAPDGEVGGPEGMGEGTEGICMGTMMGTMWVCILQASGQWLAARRLSGRGCAAVRQAPTCQGSRLRHPTVEQLASALGTHCIACPDGCLPPAQLTAYNRCSSATVMQPLPPAASFAMV